MKNKLKPGRKGLAIGAVLGMVALLAVLGAVLAANMGSSDNAKSTTQQSKLYAGAILMQAGTIKDGMDLMQANTSLTDLDQITFDAEDGTGLYGTSGTLESSKIPVNALASKNPDDAVWEYIPSDAGLGAKNFAGSANNDGYIRTKTELSDEVCAQINILLGQDDSTDGATAYCHTGGKKFFKAVNVK